MILLDKYADSIFPSGLAGTPFFDVFCALQKVSAGVFDVDPASWRAVCAWGYYLGFNVAYLAGAPEASDFLRCALVSEQAPLVKDTQTASELAALLLAWRGYTPTFERLEGLYPPFAAQADVRPIHDAESQAILPVSETARAFYVKVSAVDWERPLTLSEAETIAVRATPMGSRPFVYYGFESECRTTASAFADACYMIDAGLSDSPEPPGPEMQYHYGVMSSEGDADGKYVEFGVMSGNALISKEE